MRPALPASSFSTHRWFNALQYPGLSAGITAVLLCPA